MFVDVTFKFKRIINGARLRQVLYGNLSQQSVDHHPIAYLIAAATFIEGIICIGGAFVGVVGHGTTIISFLLPPLLNPRTTMLKTSLMRYGAFCKSCKLLLMTSFFRLQFVTNHGPSFNGVSIYYNKINRRFYSIYLNFETIYLHKIRIYFLNKLNN